jgi:hypothetical protein
VGVAVAGTGVAVGLATVVVVELPHPATNTSAATSNMAALTPKVLDLFPEVTIIPLLIKRGGGRGEVTRQHGVRNQANYAPLGIQAQYQRCVSQKKHDWSTFSHNVHHNDSLQANFPNRRFKDN